MTMRIDDLLPEGLSDRLPREAAVATATMRTVLGIMHSHGYDRVCPPLIEFESAMADRMAKTGSGNTANVYDASNARTMFRFVDPASLRSLALRSDMTVQLGRIAATSLAGAPRPLRLCYAGEIVLIRADQLDPSRQRLQMGAELIGVDSVAAAAEIVALAIETLEGAGATGISVDFTLPDLVDVLAEDALPLKPEDIGAVRRELDTKDAGGLSAIGGEAYSPLLFAAGEFERAVDRLERFDKLPQIGGVLASRIDGLKAIAERVEGNVRLTLDPTERHGFEYQSWFGFTLYSGNVRGALGRGGTYKIGGTEECATGFSLYPDLLIEALDRNDEVDRVYCPIGHDRMVAKRLRMQHYRTVEGFSVTDDAIALGCNYRLEGGELHKLS